jgi:alpha-glucosidase
MLRLVSAAFAAAAVAAAAGPYSLGDVQNITCAGSTCAIVSAVAGAAPGTTAPLRLTFFTPQIVRWWLAVDGNFSDTGMEGDVIIGPAVPVPVTLADQGAYYEVSASPTSSVVARVQKSPTLLSLLVGGVLVAQELSPLAWNDTSSWQSLVRDPSSSSSSSSPSGGLSAEYFFGGGMQNGRFSHRDNAISIGVDYNWEDGGHPNSAPWYVSSNGYGVLRNTWAPGLYDFTQSPVVTAHNESNRLDAFFALSSGAGAPGGGLKDLLGLYTYLTGPPILPPLYGLYLGDSDCYHNDRHGNSTRVVLAVAQAYHDNDMPGGWVS